jgi:hypothetical protein
MRRLRVPSIPRQESKVSVLVREVLLIGSRGRERARAMFDPGSSYSIIRRDLAEKLAHLEPLQDLDDWVFETARAGDLIQVRYRVLLVFRFDDSNARFSDEFVVFDDLSEDVIIGADTMQKWQIRLDFDSETVVYRKSAIRLRV